MNYKTLTVLALVACAGMQGCHSSNKGDNVSTAPPPTSGPTPPLTLGTTQVLERTQVNSETEEPLEVNNGTVILADSNDEISDPAIVIR